MDLRLLLCCFLTIPLTAASLPTMQVGQAKALIDRGALVVVDCRAQADYDGGHIPGALHKDLGADELGPLLPTRARQPFLLYGADKRDRSPSRAVRALQKLSAGQPVLLEGGLAAWQKAGGKLDTTPDEQADAGTIATPGTDGKQTFQNRPYWIRVPTKISADKPIRLLVWCHPASGQAQPEFTWWKRNKVLDNQTILLSPQAKSRGWTMAADGRWVTALIAAVRTTHSITADRTILGGHSSGGFFTWQYGLGRQQDFAALLIACAYPPGPVPKATDQAPFVALYHSPGDKVTPWDRMQAGRKQLDAKGYQHDLTEDTMAHSIGPKLAQRFKKLIGELDAQALK